MATVYSLVCWGGRTGKNVTLSIASPCVGMLTNTAYTGLRNGTKLVFSTSGVLPTGITAGATYYAKPTGVSTFNLYADEALTNIVNTSGTQSGTHTAKSVMMLDYFDQYGGRWGDAGSEWCYDGLISWHAARTSVASGIDEEVCEIGEAFSEIFTGSSRLDINMPAGAVRIEPRIDGVLTPAFHDGQISQIVANGTRYGFVFEAYSPGANIGIVNVSARNASIEGFTVLRLTADYSVNGVVLGFSAKAIGVISLSAYSGIGSGFAVSAFGPGAKAISCLSIGWAYGFNGPASVEQYGFYDCLSTKNNIGFYGTASSVWSVVVNCLSIGNLTTNWTTSTGFRQATNNLGGTGEAWMTTGGSRIEVTEASPFSSVFVDWTNNDLRPASSSSPQVDSAAAYYGIQKTDIAGDERPNYNNGGAEAFDVGCYEFDHGYGPHPASTTVTFSGVNAGSEIRVYDGSANELAGVEACSANPELTWTLSSGDVRIVIIHPDYKIKEFTYTPVAGVVSLPVQQEPDKWYSNP